MADDGIETSSSSSSSAVKKAKSGKKKGHELKPAFEYKFKEHAKQDVSTIKIDKIAIKLITTGCYAWLQYKSLLFEESIVDWDQVGAKDKKNFEVVDEYFAALVKSEVDRTFVAKTPQRFKDHLILDFFSAKMKWDQMIRRSLHCEDDGDACCCPSKGLRGTSYRAQVHLFFDKFAEFCCVRREVKKNKENPHWRTGGKIKEKKIKKKGAPKTPKRKDEQPIRLPKQSDVDKHREMFEALGGIATMVSDDEEDDEDDEEYEDLRSSSATSKSSKATSKSSSAKGKDIRFGKDIRALNSEEFVGQLRRSFESSSATSKSLKRKAESSSENPSSSGKMPKRPKEDLVLKEKLRKQAAEKVIQAANSQLEEDVDYENSEAFEGADAGSDEESEEDDFDFEEWSNKRASIVRKIKKLIKTGDNTSKLKGKLRSVYGDNKQLFQDKNPFSGGVDDADVQDAQEKFDAFYKKKLGKALEKAEMMKSRKAKAKKMREKKPIVVEVEEDEDEEADGGEKNEEDDNETDSDDE